MLLLQVKWIMGPSESLIGCRPSEELDAAAIILEFYSCFNAKYNSCTFLCLKTPGCFEYETHLPREWRGRGEWWWKIGNLHRITNQVLPCVFLGCRWLLAVPQTYQSKSTFVARLIESAWLFCYSGKWGKGLPLFWDYCGRRIKSVTFLDGNWSSIALKLTVNDNLSPFLCLEQWLLPLKWQLFLMVQLCEAFLVYPIFYEAFACACLVF